MRRIFFAVLVLMFTLVPSVARADSMTFDFSFTTPNTTNGASNVFAFGTLTGNSLGNGWWEATTGNITMNGTTGTLISGGPGQTTSPSGYFWYDNVINPAPGQGPFVTVSGLLFDLSGTEINIFSGIYNGPAFAGAGTNTYDLYENNGYNQNGELNLSTVTPEPSSMLLLCTGLLGMAFMLLRRKMSGVTLNQTTC